MTIAALTVGVVGMVAAPASAGGPKLFQYSVHTTEQETFSSPAEDSLCGTPETVTINAIVNAHVGATKGGLSDDQILDLIEDDPDGVIQQLTYTETGTFIVETGGHTYTGTVTQWFGAGFSGNSGQFVTTGTFSVRGTSEIGTQLLVHFVGHDLDGPDQATKLAFEHGSVTGCLP